MSLKSSLLALANNIGMCQENARSIKQALAGGLAEAAVVAPGLEGDAESVKIWTNTTPAAAMDESDITIDNSDIFDGYYIVYRPVSGSANFLIYLDSSNINDNTAYDIHYTYVASGQVYDARRTVELSKAVDSHDVKFAFSKGNIRHIDPYGTASAFSANNNDIIPIAIIGVKF